MRYTIYDRRARGSVAPPTNTGPTPYNTYNWNDPGPDKLQFPFETFTHIVEY